MAGRTQRVAVVDLGSNTTRLLVADVEDGEISEIERLSEVTRLAQGVDATGRLDQEAMQRVLDTLARYRQIIDASGAQKTVAMATSAVRDAENGPHFVATMRDEHGIEARILSGDQEAHLTFRGATPQRPDATGATLVIDIGGGSTELVVGVAGREPDFFVSTQAGSVRQTERHLNDDPPGAHQIADLAMEVQLIVEEAVPEEVLRAPRGGIAVAGTATSLAAVNQSLDPYDSAKVHGYRLSLGDCERLLAKLAALPLESRREVTGLHPERAPTIVAGAAILVEALRAFGLDEVEVSEADILHGAALEAAAEARA